MSRFGTGAVQGDDRFLGSTKRNLNLGGSDTSYPKVCSPLTHLDNTGRNEKG